MNDDKKKEKPVIMTPRMAAILEIESKIWALEQRLAFSYGAGSSANALLSMAPKKGKRK